MLDVTVSFFSQAYCGVRLSDHSSLDLLPHHLEGFRTIPMSSSTNEISHVDEMS
jgi:hypothetical protein